MCADDYISADLDSDVLESFFGTLHGSVQFLLPLFLLPLPFLPLDFALAVVHSILRDEG